MVFADDNVISALAAYMMMGLDPGSFGRAILLGDRDLAHARAHPHLKDMDGGSPSAGPFPAPAGPTGVDNLLWFAQNLVPPIARGDVATLRRWMEHDGMRGADAATYATVRRQMDTAQVLLRLQHDLRLHPVWWETSLRDVA